MNEKDIQGLATYGHSIGMAFQITDDLLDITSNEKKIGKPAGNDIRQGIVTLPVIRALDTSSDRGELAAIIENRSMEAVQIERALNIVRASDGIAFAQDRADAFLEQAKQSLPEDLPQDIYDTYIQAADFIGRRDF